MGRSKDKASDPALGGDEIRQILDGGIRLIAKRISDESISTSASDLVRLLEKRAELSERDTTQEIILTWRDENQSRREPLLGEPLQYSDPQEEIVA